MVLMLQMYLSASVSKIPRTHPVLQTSDYTGSLAEGRESNRYWLLTLLSIENVVGLLQLGSVFLGFWECESEVVVFCVQPECLWMCQKYLSTMSLKPTQLQLRTLVSQLQHVGTFPIEGLKNINSPDKFKAGFL